MTKPNWYPPDKGYHCTAQYIQGRRYSPPHQKLVHAYLTILDRERRRLNIGVWGYSLMGSHPHVLAFDKETDGPSQIWRLSQSVNSIFAKWLNWYWGTEGQIFETHILPETIPILDAKREASTFVYVFANPVAAGIVEHPAELGGATGLPEYYLEPLVISRPEEWFDPKKWPDQASMLFEVPPLASAEGMDAFSWYEHLRALCDEELERIAAEVRDERLEFKGIVEAMEDDPFVAHRERGVNFSKVAFAGTEPHDHHLNYLLRDSFWRGYGKSSDELKSIVLPLTYPFGTGRMSVTHGMRMRPRAKSRAG